MLLIPSMHDLAVPVIISMPLMAVLLVTMSIILAIFISMFIVAAPVPVTFLLGKNNGGA
jgi:hypothetical protein